MSGLSSVAVAAVALLLNGAAVAQTAAVVGDPARGEAIYGRCLACHALDRNRTGPKHCGLFGRRAGSVPGFDYSAATRRSNIVWNEKTLDRFLANPLQVIPGTAMATRASATRRSAPTSLPGSRRRARRHAANSQDGYGTPLRIGQG